MPHPPPSTVPAAAFGVILITTKSGKAGKTHVSYTGNVLFNSALHLPEMMRSDKFVRYWNRARINDGTAAQFDTGTVRPGSMISSPG